LLAVTIAESSSSCDDSCRAAAAAAAGERAGATHGIRGLRRAIVEAIVVETRGDVLVLEDVAHDELGILVSGLWCARREH
jgi:hypothetical protein